MYTVFLAQERLFLRDVYVKNKKSEKETTIIVTYILRQKDNYHDHFLTLNFNCTLDNSKFQLHDKF